MASDDKYDRQLRLWGSHGQKALMTAKICLLGAGPTGTETLKNLVLPGCGYITVVDGNRVTVADCGNNFFVTKDRIGDSRAKVVTELLVEMNPDVRGEYRDEDPVKVIASEPAYFEQFSLVIATQLSRSDTEALSTLLWDRKIPLVIARSFGLLGVVRVVVQEHLVVESKEEIDTTDLRIHDPFPELEEFAFSIDLDAAPDVIYGHTPYVLLLIRLIKEWKAAHDGKAPKTMAEQDEFKAMIQTRGGARTPWPGHENWFEANAKAYKAWATSELRDTVRNVIYNAKATELTPKSDPFWFVARAVRDFVENEGGGNLPVKANLPDMTATTELYLKLQEVYQAKAKADQAAVRARVDTLLAEVGLKLDTVSDEFLTLFLKNTATLDCVEYAPMSLEDQKLKDLKDILMMDINYDLLGDPEQAPAVWYFMMRTVDIFHRKHDRYPGQGDCKLEEDEEELEKLGAAFLKDLGMEDVPVTKKHYAEMVRFGAAEIHNIAAFIGGVASQECVKMLTKQFTPINSTFIYNGIASCSKVYNL